MKNNIIKKLEMLRKINLLLALLAVLITGGTVIAQDTSERRIGAGPSSQERLIKTADNLTKIEKLIGEITSKKTFSEANANELNQLIDNYGDDVRVAFDEILKATAEVARTPGNAGARVKSVGPDLENFEKLAMSQLSRLNAIQKNMGVIERESESGRIRIADPQAFKLFSPNILILGEYESDYDTTENESIFQLVNYKKYLNRSVALPCVNSCNAQQWSACLACVGPISNQLGSQWNSLNSCKTSCNAKKWWQRPFCKLGCLIKFVNWVA